MCFFGCVYGKVGPKRGKSRNFKENKRDLPVFQTPQMWNGSKPHNVIGGLSLILVWSSDCSSETAPSCGVFGIRVCCLFAIETPFCFVLDFTKDRMHCNCCLLYVQCCNSFTGPVKIISKLDHLPNFYPKLMHIFVNLFLQFHSCTSWHCAQDFRVVFSWTVSDDKACFSSKTLKKDLN